MRTCEREALLICQELRGEVHADACGECQCERVCVAFVYVRMFGER